jgi:hypothetical protein
MRVHIILILALGGCSSAHTGPGTGGAGGGGGGAGAAGSGGTAGGAPGLDGAAEAGGDAPAAEAGGDAPPATTDAPPGRDAAPDGSGAGPGGIQTVFLVLEENHDWSAIKALPYVQHLLQIGAHSEQYYNPKGLHPSEPNYLWIEGGSNFGRTNDDDPAINLVKGARHLSAMLDAAGISWTSYQESIPAGACPVASAGRYAAKHNPFVFFDDVVGAPPSPTSAHCIAHHKPFSQFLADLQAGQVARYNFITPNLDHDMHDGSPEAADAWLQANIDPIVNEQSPFHNPALYARSVLIVTFDEGTGRSDGPIGLIVVSPFARAGFQDTTAPTPYFYTHSSLLLTLQEVFGVAGTPLADAAGARDLSALFTTFP